MVIHILGLTTLGFLYLLLATIFYSEQKTMTINDDESKSEQEMFEEVRRLRYRSQAIWFLDSTGVGKDIEQCEEVWRIHKKCVQLDEKKEEGAYLNEFNAHRVLESCSRAIFPSEMRNFLVSVNPEYSKAKKVSLAELLILIYEVDWKNAVRQKCLDWEAKKEAEDKLDEATKKLEEATKAAERAATDAKLAQEAEEHALKEQQEASKVAEESRLAEVALFKAKEQAKETLDELNLQERKLNEQKELLEKKSKDNTLGIVKRNKAIAELNMLLSKDPIPLRTAKLSQEASFKKQSKAAKKAGEAASAAEFASKKAEAARLAAQKSKEEALETGKIAEDAIPAAQNACQTIQATLDELMRDRKIGRGTAFYLERELKVAKRFLPKNKFNEAHKKTEIEKEKMRLPEIAV